MKKLCPATYRSTEDGWVYSCDKAQGHTGLHEAEDYDARTDAFREAQWAGDQKQCA